MKMDTVGGCRFCPRLAVEKIFKKRLDFLLRQSYTHDTNKYGYSRITKKIGGFEYEER